MHMHNSGEPPNSTPPLKPADIRKTRFKKNLKGYNTQDVDSFLDDLAARIEHGESISSSDLSDAQFRLSLRGYDVREVDRYLDQMAKSTNQ